jgi:hypothetical protein
MVLMRRRFQAGYELLGTSKYVSLSLLSKKKHSTKLSRTACIPGILLNNSSHIGFRILKLGAKQLLNLEKGLKD